MGPRGVLRGMAHLPQGKGPYPAVALLHGFTGDRREDHWIFVKLARALAATGIASVRFDFYGSGESDGSFEEMTVASELADAEVIWSYLRGQSWADASRMGVLGLSLGGAIAAQLAAHHAKELARLVLWAPAGNFGELILQGFESAPPSNSAGPYENDGLEIGRALLEEAAQLELFEGVEAYRGPVLLVHGDEDQSVPLDVSRVYQARYGEQAVLHVVPGGSHTFTALAAQQEAIAATLDFLRPLVAAE